MPCDQIGKKGTLILASALLLLGTSALAQNSITSEPGVSVSFLNSTREQDGLVGSVRRVQTESARLEMKLGMVTEAPRQLLERTIYDPRGKRIENVSYAEAGSPAGRQEYKYDGKGNIAEMTLLGEDGTVLSRETYKYEFDDVGNWTKMLTSLVVLEDGEMKYEPVEVTYRKITYYFDQTANNIVESPSRLINPPIPDPVSPSLLKIESVAAVPANGTVGVVYPASVAIVAGPPPRPLRLVNPTLTDERLAPGPKPSGEASPANRTARQNAIALYKTGRDLFDRGDFRGALAAYQLSVELDPSSPETYLSMGYAYHKLNRNSEALNAFKQSIRLNPEMAEPFYGLGLEYYRMRRNKDAASAFQDAIRLRPNMAKAHYGLAVAYQELGKGDLSLAEFRTLETLDKALANQLAKTLPNFGLPCPTPPYCK